MASPALLAKRTTQAIRENDTAAFARWVGHPRWRHDVGSSSQDWLLAALGSPDPIGWLQRLVEREVPLNARTAIVPVICEAARLGQADVVGWLLDRGVSPDSVSDYGLGKTLGRTALDENAQEVMAVLWEKTGRVWTLLNHSERRLWLEPSSLSMLECMCSKGWSVHHPEPDPDRTHEGAHVSFAQWLVQRDEVPLAQKERLVAVLEETRLGRELPEVGSTNGQKGPAIKARL